MAKEYNPNLSKVLGVAEALASKARIGDFPEQYVSQWTIYQRWLEMTDAYAISNLINDRKSSEFERQCMIHYGQKIGAPIGEEK